MRNSVVACLILCLNLCPELTTALRPPAIHNSATLQRAATFDWSSLNTLPYLNYTTCYEDFDCARLEVPLDWQDLSNNHTISLAVIRRPAQVPVSDPRHGGSIITNPGGPGGSGVMSALGSAEDLQRRLDENKYYEIVSFDPRGVFLTLPNAYCFQNSVEAELWSARKQMAGRLNDGNATLAYHWAAEEARGRLCESDESDLLGDGENVRRYLSTAYTARDVLELVGKIDEEKQSALSRPSNANDQTIFNAKTRPKLQYYAGSYGTFLGQTFAALYPESVGRMVLDANIDADNWVSRYPFSVHDSAAIQDYFFERCFAGRSNCPYWRPQDKNPSSIKSRYNTLIDSLTLNPMPITGQGRATVMTRADLEQGFFTTLYQPRIFFLPFATILDAISTGQEPPTLFWQDVIPTQETISDEVLTYILHGKELTSAIHCSDGPDLSPSSLADFQLYLANVTEQAAFAGAIQADFKISCWQWPASLRTKWRFTGPFNTSVPILFVNNRLDPVTPIRNARKMAEQFEGSVVLEQDSVGHGATLQGGKCVWEWVRRYFETGEMPAEGTVCEIGGEPFGDDAVEGEAMNDDAIDWPFMF